MLDVQLGRAVFIKNGRQTCEGPARFGDNRNRDRRTHTALSFLDTKVGQKHLQDILWSNRSRNVPKAVNCRTSHSLLMCLQQIEQLKANAHPLTRTHKLGTTVSNTANEVDTRFLYPLMAIAEDGRHARQQIPDGWIHLRHAHDVGNRTLSGDHTRQCLGEFFAQLLEENNAQIRKQCVLTTLLEHSSQLGRKVRGLLARAGVFVVETPQNRRHNLHEVRLNAHAQRMSNGACPVKHDAILIRLLLERIDHAVHQLHFQSLSDIGRAERRHDMPDRIHRHATERLALILEKVDQSLNDLTYTHFVR